MLFHLMAHREIPSSTGGPPELRPVAYYYKEVRNDLLAQVDTPSDIIYALVGFLRVRLEGHILRNDPVSHDDIYGNHPR